MFETAELRVLEPGDEERLFEFLSRHVDSSLFIFSNVERAGLVDRGEPFQGTYVASLDATGAITAVAGHSWSGRVLVQGDVGLEQAALRAVALSGRKVAGFSGPWAQVCRARRALGFEHTLAAHEGAELLFSLALDDLVMPELLERHDVGLRAPTAAEARELLGGWRVDYQIETLGAKRSAQLEQQAAAMIEAWRVDGTLWVLTVGAEICCMTGFSAETRGVAQIGGVFTPKILRGRGYARAAVAASLRLASARGVTRSVLFTAETNQAARRCYSTLGYRVVGDFGLVLL